MTLYMVLKDLLRYSHWERLGADWTDPALQRHNPGVVRIILAKGLDIVFRIKPTFRRHGGFVKAVPLRNPKLLFIFILQYALSRRASSAGRRGLLVSWTGTVNGACACPVVFFCLRFSFGLAPPSVVSVSLSGLSFMAWRLSQVSCSLGDNLSLLVASATFFNSRYLLVTPANSFTQFFCCSSSFCSCLAAPTTSPNRVKICFGSLSDMVWVKSKIRGSSSVPTPIAEAKNNCEHQELCS